MKESLQGPLNSDKLRKIAEIKTFSVVTGTHGRKMLRKEDADINLDRSFYRFVTIHACDGRTDRRTDRILIARPRLHSMQRGKNCFTGMHKRNEM